MALRGNQPFASVKLGQSNEISMRYLTEDMHLIVVSLRSLSLDSPTDYKRIVSLLEALDSILQTNKHESAKKLNLIEPIVLLCQYLKDVKLVLRQTTDRTSSDWYQLQNLLLKNIRNLLKLSDPIESVCYVSLFVDCVDSLIQLKETLTIANNCTNDGNNRSAQLNSNVLLLLKCIFYLSSQCEFQINEVDKASLCAKYLGILRCFAFYGLANYELGSLPVQLYPSPIGQLVSADAGELGRKRRRTKVCESELDDGTLFNTTNSGNHSFSASASEYSSSEIDEESLRNALHKERHCKKIYANIRMLAYESLNSALSLFGIRNVFGFWSFFFPDHVDERGEVSSIQFSVLHTISRDINRVRISALNFMYFFFDYGKLYVRSLVSESSHIKPNSKQAFTPLSVAFTSMVKELHSFFERLLLSETNSSILILIYKVLSMVVQITPYNKLRTDILHNLFYRNSFMLEHKVTQIKNLSLVLYVKMFTPESLPNEFECWLTESSTGPEVMSKIFKHCFEFIHNPDYILLCVESIKLLTSLVRHHRLMMRLCGSSISVDLHSLSSVAVQTMQSQRSLTNPVLQSLVCKYVHALGLLFKHIATSKVAILGEQHEKLQSIKDWYLQVFATDFFRKTLIEPDLAVVKIFTQVTLINVIALMPDEVFGLLEDKLKYHIITMLISIAKGDEFSDTVCKQQEQEDATLPVYTKTAAIRCLSILQSFACLSDDMSFSFDLIDICLDNLHPRVDQTKSQKKKNICLLEHSLWALANICDCIKKNGQENEMDYALLNRVIARLTDCFDLHRVHYHTDDILVNLARCSGIVLYIIYYKQSLSLHTSEQADSEIEPSTMMHIVAQLVNFLPTKRLYKLQWNICIAFSHLLPIERFVEHCQQHRSFDSNDSTCQNLLLHLYDALYQTYNGTANHKVQSYSIYTICKIHSLDHFTSHLVDLWPSVVRKFVSDFYSVPVDSKLSWLQKYVFALSRLLSDYILLKHDNLDQEANEHLDKLSSFVTSELDSDDLEEAAKQQLHILHQQLQLHCTSHQASITADQLS